MSWTARDHKRGGIRATIIGQDNIASPDIPRLIASRTAVHRRQRLLPYDALLSSVIVVRDVLVEARQHRHFVVRRVPETETAIENTLPFPLGDLRTAAGLIEHSSERQEAVASGGTGSASH